MPKIWLPQNVREAFNPNPIELVQKQNPRVTCDLIVNLTETSFKKVRMVKRHDAVCCVCGKRSSIRINGTVENPELLYFCNTRCSETFKQRHGGKLPNGFRREES